MPAIFETSPGQAVALVDSADIPLSLQFSGWPGAPAFQALVTEVSIALDGNYQFTHTFSDLVFVYVYGDRISQLRIAGVTLAGLCPGSTGVSGLEQVLGFYKANKIANRAIPSQIQLGTSPAGYFEGYLCHLKADIVKAEARLAQFALIYSILPEPGADSGAGVASPTGEVPTTPATTTTTSPSGSSGLGSIDLSGF